MSEEPVLSLRDLHRTYRSGDRLLHVLDGAELDLKAGEIVGLVGPSGSGKSSLLHAAGLLERPTSGRVLVEGRDCTDLSDALRGAGLHGPFRRPAHPGAARNHRLRLPGPSPLS